MNVVPDTSVIVDGRITLMVESGELQGATILIPEAVIAELEFQANQGRESGFHGLDEIMKLNELARDGKIAIQFLGDRPSPTQIEGAKRGDIDAIIREVAFKNEAMLITSDRVQSHVARAKGIPTRYIRPIIERGEMDLTKGIKELGIMRFFDDKTMSVHLKENCFPFAKRGAVGDVKLEQVSSEKLSERMLTRMSREIVEAAKREPNAFIEIERKGATVVQLGSLRIAIARPPFSDGIEITAVKPVVKLRLEDYRLAPELIERLTDIQRGMFISGPPGSGKTTFAQSIAEFLASKGKIVKTMESPRDLQVPDTITQYAPLEDDMGKTADILLLVRPDFVIFDEVRKTPDFEIYGDMRLAGVGMIGVTHANRAIDAVQRLMARVDLGMIPQIVDTVIHIEKGEIVKILELVYTVKVPRGMVMQDLARPVIEVVDFVTQAVEYEIYTFGEQTVVMPVAEGRMKRKVEETPADLFTKEKLRRVLDKFVTGEVEIELREGNAATVYVAEEDIPRALGKGGRRISEIEEALGMHIDILPKRKISTVIPRIKSKFKELQPEVRETKSNITLLLPSKYKGQKVSIFVDGKQVGDCTAGMKGDVKVARSSELGNALADALDNMRRITVRI